MNKNLKIILITLGILAFTCVICGVSGVAYITIKSKQKGSDRVEKFLSDSNLDKDSFTSLIPTPTTAQTIQPSPIPTQIIKQESKLLEYKDSDLGISFQHQESLNIEILESILVGESKSKTFRITKPDLSALTFSVTNFPTGCFPAPEGPMPVNNIQTIFTNDFTNTKIARYYSTRSISYIEIDDKNNALSCIGGIQLHKDEIFYRVSFDTEFAMDEIGDYDDFDVVFRTIKID